VVDTKLNQVSVLLGAAPEGYQERARLQVFDAGVPAVASPSFSEGRLFLRSADEMVAIAIGSRE